jgi:hypothetical protein
VAISVLSLASGLDGRSVALCIRSVKTFSLQMETNLSQSEFSFAARCHLILNDLVHCTGTMIHFCCAAHFTTIYSRMACIAPPV